MKKYLSTILLGLITGIFLCTLFTKTYTNNELKVSSGTNKLYFVQYGVYSSIDSMEKNTISLENYIYTNIGDLYYVFIAITNNEDALEIIKKYYKDQNIDTIVKEFNITNKKFVNIVNKYDKEIINTKDNSYISSLISEVLVKYEEENSDKN